MEVYSRKMLSTSLDGKVLKFKDTALYLNGTTYQKFHDQGNPKILITAMLPMFITTSKKENV